MSKEPELPADNALKLTQSPIAEGSPPGSAAASLHVKEKEEVNESGHVEAEVVVEKAAPRKKGRTKIKDQPTCCVVV